MHESGMNRILAERTAVVEYEGKEVVRKCLTKKLMAYTDQYFEKGQNFQVMMNGRWQGGFRFVGTLHRIGLVEEGHTVTKAPSSFIRPSPSALIQLGEDSLNSAGSGGGPNDSTASIIPRIIGGAGNAADPLDAVSIQSSSSGDGNPVMFTHSRWPGGEMGVMAVSTNPIYHTPLWASDNGSPNSRSGSSTGQCLGNHFGRLYLFKKGRSIPLVHL